ncbi:hypothetical protein ACHAQJ_004902 [Trichoderma viride]
MSPRISRLSAVAALAAVASAATASIKAAEPCAQIAKLFASGTNSFSSQLGLACLESMPFKSDPAVSFVDELGKYLQWQSDIEILRNPPPGSLSATVDLLGGMSSIRSRAASSLYKSQYDFDMDINNLLSSANDGHLGITPCSFVMAFINPAHLVSLSTDGITIPKLYTLSDGYLLADGNTEVSAVTLINGVGAEAYIEQLSSLQVSQDADARYNAMLGNVPITRGGANNPGNFAGSLSFPGVHEYNLTYANGTQATYPLTAEILSGAPKFTFTTGEELYQAVCAPLPNKTDSSSEKTKRADPKESPAPSTYPKPIVKDPFNVFVGYFPDDKSLEDVAVLTVSSFETAGDDLPEDEIKNFALGAQKFVNEAVAAGKSKMIIDLTGNGGGTVVSGFALVSIFFPNMTIFSATRYRSVPATQFIVEAASRSTDPNVPDVFSDYFVPGFVKPDQKSTFPNTSDFLGPFDEFGVPSTAIVAGISFSQTNSTLDPINIDGLGGQLNGTTPPFRPENIIILSDGQCASTCTIFINHMIPYGVRVVATGGRATRGPMQGIGGIKGSQTLTLASISQFYEFAAQLIQEAEEAKKPLFTDKEYAVFKDAIPMQLADLPIQLTTGQINFRNAFSPFNDQLPTQYVYQPADCRLFYTPQSLSLPETLWVNTANAVWNSGGCAFTVAPEKPILFVNSTASAPAPSTTSSAPSTTSSASLATSSPASTKKKTQSSAHKAVGLLLAIAEGLRL